MAAQLDKKYICTRPWKVWSRLIAYLFTEGRPVTTRGQWINPLLFSLFYIQKKLPQLKNVVSPVYILGTGRSGTTILGMVLSMHRHIGYLNEPKALWHSAVPGEDLIGSYDKGKARYRFCEEDATDVKRIYLSKLYGAYLRLSCSSRVVDKYPEMIFRVPFVLRLFPDAKFIFLSRNGWDTCHSITNWSTRLATKENNEVHDWWGVNKRKWSLLVDEIVPEHEDLLPYQFEMKGWTNHQDMAIVEWIVTMREGMRLLSEYPASVLGISYEQLCGDPERHIEKISEFINLDQDAVYSRYAVESFSSVSDHPKYEMSECIRPAFQKTMTLLGYNL